MAAHNGTNGNTVSVLERRRYSFWRLVRANLYDLTLLVRESRLVLGAFLLVILAGTLYASMRYREPPLAALYETLQLLVFQSNRSLPADPLGEALFFLLPLLGLALIVQSVLNFGRRVLDKSSRREAWQVALASTYSNHVIVCGLGRLGYRVVTRLLEAGYEPVVVDQSWNSRFVPRALNLRVPVVVGDAREPVILRQAGLRRARAVIADINNDQADLEIALAARTERPGIRVVLRAFSDQLDQSLDRIFGEDSAFSQSALAAPTLAAAAVSREITYAIPIDDELLGVAELVIASGGKLSGSVREYEMTFGVRTLDHRSASGHTVRRGPREALEPGDHVTLLGTLRALEALRLRNATPGQQLPLQHPTAEFNTIIVCGVGKVGYRVIDRLCRLPLDPRPEIVAIYQRDDDSTFLDRVRDLRGVTLLKGDARDEHTLMQAGLDHAFAVVGATSDDLTNLQTGLAARGRRPDVHLVLRVFSEALAEELNAVYEIHTTFSTSNLASPTLAAAGILTGIRGGGVDRAFTVGGTIFSSDDFRAEPEGLISGRSVDELRAERGLLVLALDRPQGRELLPALETRIEPGDTGILVAPLEALARLRITR